uniref:diguanylate cyclase n=1 Tax=Desulfovibrio sp. U5L TaxID=596152 RepID=I2Q3B1_9BACT
MVETSEDHACALRNLCGDLHKIGCGEDPAWLAVLLFVRDLVRHFSLFSDVQKKAVQRFVFSELARRDPSERQLRRIVTGLEGFLAENSRTAALRQALAAEKKATHALAESVGAFWRESLASERERGKLLGRFGCEAMGTLSGESEPAAMVARLRGLVTDMLTHYREEALAWEQKANQLEKTVRVDPLLAPLHNRRALDSHLGQAIAGARDGQKPLAVLMIDVDNFKTSINDVHGHTVGDDVLRALAKIIDAHAAKNGWFAARYGGDELVLACGLDGETAEFHADAIRLAVQQYEFRPRVGGKFAGTPIRFTVSIGVAAYEPGMTAEDLVAAADKAMYRVKGTGRNNVARFAAAAPA